MKFIPFLYKVYDRDERPFLFLRLLKKIVLMTINTHDAQLIHDVDTSIMADE